MKPPALVISTAIRRWFVSSVAVSGCVLALSPAAAAQSSPPINGVTGTIATEGTVESEDPAARTVIVKTIDGVAVLTRTYLTSPTKIEHTRPRLWGNRRMLSRMADNSPKAIAKRLNKEGIAGPNGCPSSPSTIHGHADAGPKFSIANCMSVASCGTVSRYVRDPDTGKRLGPNPASEWITTEVPALRIIDDDLRSRVKARQRGIPSSSKTLREEFNRFRRPKYLFSG